MLNDFSRRTFLQMFSVGAVGALGAKMNDAVAQIQTVPVPSPTGNKAFSNRISVAQWSFHRMLKSGELAPLDFACFAHKNCGVMGVEIQSVQEMMWSRHNSVLATLGPGNESQGDAENFFHSLFRG